MWGEAISKQLTLPSALHVFETFLAGLNWHFDHLDVFIARDFINILATILSYYQKIQLSFSFTQTQLELNCPFISMLSVGILTMSKAILPASNLIEQTSMRPLSSLLSPSNKTLRIILEILEKNVYPRAEEMIIGWLRVLAVPAGNLSFVPSIHSSDLQIQFRET